MIVRDAAIGAGSESEDKKMTRILILLCAVPLLFAQLSPAGAAETKGKCKNVNSKAACEVKPNCKWVKAGRCVYKWGS